MLHPTRYLSKLTDSSAVAKFMEMSTLSYLPSSWIDNSLLRPMRYAVQGSLLASEKAIEYGWSINLSGGYHHASAEAGGGFCVYGDISLIVLRLQTKYSQLRKVMIIDLDAHQGNGYERDKHDGLFNKKCKDMKVFIFDMYNQYIYPRDYESRRAIDYNGELSHHCSTDTFLKQLRQNLAPKIDHFQPEFVIYNAGTDCLEHDPLGNLDISEEGVIERDQIVFDECLKRNIPITMLLSGGYQKNNAAVITRSLLNLNKKFKLFSQPNWRDRWLQLYGSQKRQKQDKEEKQEQKEDECQTEKSSYYIHNYSWAPNPKIQQNQQENEKQ
ncbi:histone deacetylase [Reticulomyxa filosa]|uniref:Histone deacetylase n=1 Tax=Reticulomyxa filosa TaxID=46433 RepID=X6NXD3_RETFI|nr:histone deacetylase [Reticulomyxa filosa]|eukprot:ETO30548.1 histone deacetylase [Reticulomyxa filosa]